MRMLSTVTVHGIFRVKISKAELHDILRVKIFKAEFVNTDFLFFHISFLYKHRFPFLPYFIPIYGKCLKTFVYERFWQNGICKQC